MITRKKSKRKSSLKIDTTLFYSEVSSDTRYSETISDKKFFIPSIEEYDLLLNYNYKIKQLQQICNKNIDKYPFLSFVQKKNFIYKYENNKWDVLTIEEFEKIVTKIYSSILKQFKIWQDENEEKIFNNSDFSELYTKNVKKLVGNIPIKEQKIKIFNNFYKSIQLDLQNTIEYEFS